MGIWKGNILKERGTAEAPHDSSYIIAKLKGMIHKDTNANGKTNLGLVEYCKAQLGRPYWYGTFGRKASQAIYDYNRKRYPAYYTDTDFASQYGQKVHDCIGLLKGYMWCEDADDTNPKYQSNGMDDFSADGFYRHCKRKSTNMSEMPDVVGIAVFMSGHIGYYIGNGEVIEARGHRYGVVITKLNERPWKKWACIEEIEYL